MIQKTTMRNLSIKKNSLLCYYFSMKENNVSWLELDSAAFENNAKQIKLMAGDGVNVAAVIKGNAYGHGLAPVAQLCEQSSFIDWLCAISLSEALALRTHGITKPILVLSFIDENPIQAINHDIDLVVQDINTALSIHEQASTIKKNARIHIKIDTGLSRLGFTPENALSAIQRLQELSYLEIVGISTHFANTSNPHSEFTTKQLLLFEQTINRLENNGIFIPIKHAANSAATLHHANTRYNFVRIGAALYGLLPSTDSYQQTPIATWKTNISFIKTVDSDTFVGYDLTYQTTEPTKIAILPVGYYHGYRRTLSNKSVVLIKNKITGTHEYAPVIGRICMNQMLINITHIADVSIGDEVILMGPYDKIRPYDLAIYAESYNPRDITTTINETMKRIIIKQRTIQETRYEK